MNKRFTIYMMLLLLPMISIGNSASLFSQNDVKPVLRNYYDTRLCGTERNKEILILLEVGNVALKDSLYGFDFSVSYDPELIKFETPVYINTLAEFFEWKDINFALDHGKVKGYALANHPMGGNKPLIGFLGKYIHDCNVATPLVLEYLEFTDDFQKNVINSDTLWIKPNMVENPDYIYNIAIEEELFVFEDEDTKLFQSKIEYVSNVSNEDLSFDVRIDSDNYVIEAIEPLNSSFEILEQNVLQDGVNLKVKLNDLNPDIYEFSILLREIRKDSNQTYKLNVVPLQLSECNCVSEYNGDFVEIRTVIDGQDTTVSVVEDKHYSNYIKVLTDDVYVTIDNQSANSMKAIYLFNYEGKLVNTFLNISHVRYSIDKSHLTPGVYFLNIQMSDLVFVKKAVLIYN
ncbi:MAG: T9SS type A sorting domain-containing protein [Candidatus Kapabacteria bacterium]|nr:T9SS type A sorting domain-containing protein [Candidatus Kapabacteria bacterium]